MAFFVERPIPERPYFKVGEAAHILGVAPSTVRYWQKEFPSHIKAELSRSGQNVFSRCDVIVMAVILNLVRTDGMSLKDARTRLTEVISEHGGRIDRIQLCQQFELPLIADVPAAIVIEPIEAPVARTTPDSPYAQFEPPGAAAIATSAMGVRDSAPVINIPPAPALPAVQDSSAIDALRAGLGEEVSRMQAELDSQLAMNEFLSDENLRLRRMVDELAAGNHERTEAIRDTLRQILSEIGG